MHLCALSPRNAAARRFLPEHEFFHGFR
jgi:hypothetical protein